MLIETFVGNTSVKESLLASLKAGRLSHSVLISGQKGNGVNAFALLLACDLLEIGDVEGARRGRYPRLRIMEGDTGVRKDYSVRSIREMIRELDTTSINYPVRVFLLKNCERLNSSSGNALLKTLEEPHEGVVFILTTNDLSAIMPTVRSRCSIYRLNDAEPEEARRFLLGEGAPESFADDLIGIYGGNIGKSLACVRDPERFRSLRKNVDVYNALRKADAYTAAKLLYPASKDRRALARAFDDIIDICSRKLDDVTVRMTETAGRYRSMLNTNVNLNLLIECFAADAAKKDTEDPWADTMI